MCGSWSAGRLAREQGRASTTRGQYCSCTVDLRLQGRRGREVLAQPLGSRSQVPRESREILGVCGWEVGGPLQGGPWKESSQSVKERVDQSSLTLEEKHIVVYLGVQSESEILNKFDFGLN